MSEPGALGRLVEHDERSKAYPFKAARATTFKSVQHQSHIGILDQGSSGSCVGHATVAAVASDPFWLPVASRKLDHDLAMRIYADATTMDPWPESYDLATGVVDTGTSGLAGAKAAKVQGLISGYQWAFTFDDAMAALMQGPVITGIAWMSSFDRPDSEGNVTITPQATVRGGHEIAAVGFDADKGRVVFQNSWGPGWGAGGRFSMSTDDWRTLLANKGDVTAFVPADKPAPTPDPGAATFHLPPATSARLAAVAKRRAMSPDEWLDQHLRAYFGLK